jgi:hypothetical protein
MRSPFVSMFTWPASPARQATQNLCTCEEYWLSLRTCRRAVWHTLTDLSKGSVSNRNRRQYRAYRVPAHALLPYGLVVQTDRTALLGPALSAEDAGRTILFRGLPENRVLLQVLLVSVSAQTEPTPRSSTRLLLALLKGQSALNCSASAVALCRSHV